MNMYMKMNNFFDPIFVICVAIVVFCLLQAYFGITLQRFIKTLFNPTNIEYFALLLILGLLYFYIKMAHGTIYCLDEETENKLMEVGGNTVNIQNPNINIPG